jgi:copper(I)-binding protein
MRIPARCIAALGTAAAAAALAGCGVNSDVDQAHEPSGAQVANAQVDHSTLFLRGVYVQPKASGGPVVVASIINTSDRGHRDRLTGVSTPAASGVRPVRVGTAATPTPASTTGAAASSSPTSASASPMATRGTPSSGASASGKDLTVRPRIPLRFVDPTVGSVRLLEAQQHQALGGGAVLELRMVGVKHKLHNGTSVQIRFTFANAGSRTVAAPVVTDPGTTGLYSRND